MGTATKAAGDLYPHQWSWDAAFIAIGLAHLDTDRAITELRSLLAAQWENGKIPHIVFNDQAPQGSYWPSANHWICRVPRPDHTPDTSGLCQPPVHAIAALRVWRAARERGGAAAQRAREFLVDAYPRLVAWHRYLLTARDPETSGLVTIYHPWESGMYNSPRWDSALARSARRHPADFLRVDLAQGMDVGERPTDAEYERYAWLVELLRDTCYDDAATYRTHPFLVKDVFASGLLVAANEALLRIAQLIGVPAWEQSLIKRWWERGRAGMDRSWAADLGVAVDYDLRAGQPMPVRTVAGLAPLVAGSTKHLEAVLETLESPAFLGHPDLRWRLPPSASPLDSGFQSRGYWRGPVWPVINWLLWWSLERLGHAHFAARIRRASLEQVADTGVLPEYVEPFTGEPLGAHDQSWTAAVVLDWLAVPEAPRRSQRRGIHPRRLHPVTRIVRERLSGAS